MLVLLLLICFSSWKVDGTDVGTMSMWAVVEMEYCRTPPPMAGIRTRTTVDMGNGRKCTGRRCWWWIGGGGSRCLILLRFGVL